MNLILNQRIEFRITVFFLLVINLLSAQQTVVIAPENCEESIGVFYNWSFNLTNPDGNKQEIKIDYGESFIKILNHGKYEIEYESIYGKKEIMKFEVSGNDTVSYTYCIDKLSVPTERTSIIKNLKIKDKYQLFFDSGGCFHRDLDTINVCKYGTNNYIALIGSDSLIVNETVLDLLVKIEDVIRFGRPDANCTTREIYVVKLNDETRLSYIDESCRWWAFRKLKSEINKLNKIL